jgi:hypothetical protein
MMRALTTSSGRRRRWWGHALGVAFVALVWVGVSSLTNEGAFGWDAAAGRFGEELLLFVAAGGVVAYAVLTSIAMIWLARVRFGAAMIHGPGAALALLGALLFYRAHTRLMAYDEATTGLGPGQRSLNACLQVPRLTVHAGPPAHVEVAFVSERCPTLEIVGVDARGTDASGHGVAQFSASSGSWRLDNTDPSKTVILDDVFGDAHPGNAAAWDMDVALSVPQRAHLRYASGPLRSAEVGVISSVTLDIGHPTPQ